MTSETLLERKFRLEGKLSREELDRGRALLANDVQDFLSGLTDDEEKRQYGEILQYLQKPDMSGNEAGASVFSSFATTEIEEALRRRSRGEQVRYLYYRYNWHNNPHKFRNGRFPTHLAIESTSICNLKCPMCFQTDPLFYKDKSNLGNMKFDLYKKIIDEGAEKGLYSIKLSIRGEPMLNRELEKMVAYARDKGIMDIMFNTNGTYLNDERSRELLKAEPHLIIFSIDSMNKERFERIRKNAKFEQVVGNVERFLEIKKKEFPDSYTKTRVQMTVVPEAQQDIEELRNYWTGKVDQVAIKRVLIRMHNHESKFNKPCRVLWQRLDIHFNGKVWLCDNDYLGKLLLGDVNEETVEEVWNKPLLKDLRERHQSGKKNTIDPCKFCDGL